MSKALKYPLVVTLAFLAVAIAAIAGLPVAPQEHEEGWLSLFNGNDLAGWRANIAPESFSVVDGAIRMQAPKERAHLFYVGDLSQGFVTFRNFEFEATVRGDGASNSGIFFHTDMSVRDESLHLGKGYEVQLNNTSNRQKTGSLYDVVEIHESPVDETQWFKIRITVREKHIVIQVNDEITVDYTEPDDVVRKPNRTRRLIDPQGGAVALQTHDSESIYYFKGIRLRPLP